jgi:hypothetical protein
MVAFEEEVWLGELVTIFMYGALPRRMLGVRGPAENGRR